MLHSIKFNFFIPIYIVIFIVSSSIFSHGKMLDGAVLNVGEELKAETLSLKMGSRVYKLQDLKSLTWYEVKISYPASGGLHILVTVEPEGFVAIPNTKEREFIIFNIVCDELLLGIPYYAWWVVAFVVLCLVSALIIPTYLPSYLLRDQNVAKQS
ncbi:hypothetical protein ES319_A07G025600v1 [Gossypium barbadense]|uniref:Uncharacterized protein n=4 Tax=Gossypium TaxID=3633 RepID=A0A5J5UYJ0_GOSBA|nr:hypothetical protein ES319_A07G025600v1 [Gossypium barbadense]TYI17453.1 hypothetical protein ES332_A07G025200v1 [Gossypium tomentosum]